MDGPSEYETEMLKAIHAWKNPELGWFGQAMRLVNWPLERLGDILLNTPGIGDVIKASVNGVIRLANDLSQWSVRPEAIYEEFRAAGHDVSGHDDILKLDLKQIDSVIGWLDAKYKGVALAEGAAAGFVGLAGIPPDILALTTLNFRAIGEYATYCGFDISLQEERLFALNVLGLASSPNDLAKQAAMAQLVRLARDVAQKRTWVQLEQHAFTKLIQQIAKALGIRLTKAKLAQVIPATGALVGGGFNSYYTAKVCDAAFYLYRERFLAAKYGPDIIEVTVQPSTDLDPHYEEEQEPIPE
jgi:hypothetical protein